MYVLLSENPQKLINISMIIEISNKRLFISLLWQVGSLFTILKKINNFRLKYNELKKIYKKFKINHLKLNF